jgi:hypothetical protein
VRRVASWLGLLILAIDQIKDDWWIPRSRPARFYVNPTLTTAAAA